jgi:hypothetical protein
MIKTCKKKGKYNFKDARYLDLLKCNVFNSRDVTCGGKPMTFFGLLDNKRFFAKEFSGDTAKDAMILHECLSVFGLKQLENYQVVKFDYICRKVDKKTSTWINNCKWNKTDDVTDYIICDVFDGRNITKHDLEADVATGNWKQSPSVFFEFIYIALYRHVFQSTDFAYANVMINHKRELLSVDMGNIFKKKDIFGNFKTKDNVPRLRDHEFICNLFARFYQDREAKIAKIQETMLKYGYDVEAAAKCVQTYKDMMDIYTNELNKATLEKQL